MEQSRKRKLEHVAVGMILMVVLLAIVTILVANDLVPLPHESVGERNQRVLLRTLDIPKEAVERISRAMESVGIGKIKDIGIYKDYQSFFTFYVVDDKEEKYHLTVTTEGSLSAIYKVEPVEEYLFGIEL